MIAIEEYVARASNIDNADIIIFPEAVLWTYGLISLPNSSTTPRDLIQSYGESLPPVESIPCNDNTRPQDGTFSISKHISCMSIKYKITIVINTIDIRKCNRTAGDINCPLDGRYQYNTDVVFDGQNGGKIAAIYHKYHLFGIKSISYTPVLDNFLLPLAKSLVQSLKTLHPPPNSISESGLWNYGLYT